MEAQLNTIPLFSGLTPDQQAALLSLSRELAVDKGALIFQEGDPGKGFYIVVHGKIKVFKISLEGKEQILHIYGPGHIFGEVPVFQGTCFPASSMALEPSKILFLPRDEFVAQISASPALAMNMLADLSRRLREFTVQIEHLSLKEVPARLAAYLLTLSQAPAGHPGGGRHRAKAPDTARVTLPVSKVQLAGLIGTTPETISRIFKRMAQANLITVRGREIDIRDREGLKKQT